MTKQIIYAPTGKNYLSEFITELPANCLFDKGKTGCGGTTIAIESDRNTIIAMPYVNAIKNKEAQYPNSRCSHKLLGIYEGITGSDITDYINTHEIKKFAVTYDSLERLITVLQGTGIDVFSEYYLLVDEWHILFNSYAFRNKAVKKTLEYSLKFEEVTYMTATPVEEEFILKELRDLPVVEVQWPDVAATSIKPIETKNPAKTVCKIVSDAIAGKIFGNLHFFVNSVEFIAEVIRKTGLQPAGVRVVCSANGKTGKGNRSNQRKLGADFPIETANGNVKRINFYTSTCFEGCDIYDADGKTYIVSDKRKSHTLLDISTLFIQICGRIRNSQYNTKVGHIFSETRYRGVTLEEFEAKSEEQRNEAQLLVDSINAMPEKARKMDISLHERSNKAGLNEMYIFNNNGFLELDENLINLDIVNFKITNHLYQSRITLLSEYAQCGFTVGKVVEDTSPDCFTDRLLANPKARIPFRELFDEYAKLRSENRRIFTFGNIPDRVSLIEQEKPVIREAYEKLGVERVRELKYHVTNIQRAIVGMQTDASLDTKIVRCLKDAGIQPGTSEPVKDFKKMLQEIYASLEMKTASGKIKTAKATDLSKWYEVKKAGKKVNGKTVDYYTIIREKIVFG